LHPALSYVSELSDGFGSEEENGVLGVKVWRRLLGVDDRTVIERVEFDEEADAVVAHVRPRRLRKRRCGRCGRRSPGYDQGEGRRRWRALDLGEVRSFLEAEAPRVDCAEHGPTVVQFPWARHGAGHTRAFDDVVAWLAVHASKTAVVELVRIAWATVGAIVSRVVDEARAAKDPFDGLARIGIDEVSYKRGHRYLTVVVDHDSGRLVWAAKGHDKKTLQAFFDLLGQDRCGQVRLVSCDAAEWIGDVVRERCPNATICLDAFHVVKWATEALDEVRRDTWNEARRGGMRAHARDLKGARYALWKNPEDLTERQQAKLAWIAQINSRLYRAYLL
jgi:transposase